MEQADTGLLTRSRGVLKPPRSAAISDYGPGDPERVTARKLVRQSTEDLSDILRIVCADQLEGATNKKSGLVCTAG